MSQPTCSLLPWDSEFFGYPVARLHERRVDARVLADAFGWCTARAVRCLYYLAPADDAASLLAAQAAGMQFVDIRLTLTRTLASDETWAVGATITPATEADQALLVALAPHLARVSRFSADPRFGHEAAVRLHTAWLRKEAGAALAARTPNGVGGCIKCDVEPDGTGVISLLVVAPENSGQNLGVALCAAGLNWFVAQGCARARVVTQGHNIASQHVYQRAGFMTRSVEVWFHKWFE